MKTIGDKLKDARLAKSLKQSEVAEKLGCAATSLTNWEKGKVSPSLEVLSNLCDIYEISPLSLLNRKFSYPDLVVISKKPVPERTYEEQIALNFSDSILSKLLQADAIRRQSEETERTAAFIRKLNLLDRFGGSMNKAEITAIRSEYELNGAADEDILFAYHSLNKETKSAFLSMLAGLITDDDNVQQFNDRMDKAQAYTAAQLREFKKEL